MGRINDLSIDDLIAQATCAVIKDATVSGTAWLVSKEGHLLTAGHVLGTDNPLSEVEVQFAQDKPRKAYKIQWVYQRETGDDFAVLLLESLPSGRYPIAISLKRDLTGDFRVHGYGLSLRDRSVGRAEYLGPFDPQRAPENRLFQFRSPELGEGGYSGAAVYSDELGAVVAIQIEATDASSGAGRDTILAMPLYRIATKWNDLYNFEPDNSAPVKTNQPQRPKYYLEQRIIEGYDFILAYDEALHSSDELNPSQILINKYREVIGQYLRIYLSLCKRLRLPPSEDVRQIGVQLGEVDIDSQITDSDFLETRLTDLPGTRIIRVNVSQMFRIADLLTRPETVRARRLYEAITDVTHMRRALNDRKAFRLGALGSLRPITKLKSSEEYDRFWRIAVPDFRLITNPILCFIPYELPLTNQINTLRYDPESLLDAALLSNSDFIRNSQVSGRLRIYPPGIGVINLGITLEFKDSVYIEPVAKIARDIEGLLFVDPDGLEKPYSTLMLEIVDQVIKQLFIKEGLSYEERRYLPPTTTFSIYDGKGFIPGKRITELAYLMSLAPKNEENMQYLKNRVKKSLRLPFWKKDQMIAVAGQGVAIFFIADSVAKGRKRKRANLLELLTESHEVVSAAAYAQQAFAEEIYKISSRRLLDESWLPSNGEKFIYLFSLLYTMQQVMQAIYSVGSHIYHQRTGVLMALGKAVWNYSNPVDRASIQETLEYIKNWLEDAGKIEPDERITHLQKILKDIENTPAPFSEEADPFIKALELPLQEELERRLLAELQEIDQIIKTDFDERAEEFDQHLKTIQQLRKQLGLE